MKNNDHYNPRDFEELSKQVDALLDEPNVPAQYSEPDLLVEEGVTYQNFSNGYNRPQPDPEEYRDYGGQRPTRAAKAAAGIPSASVPMRPMPSLSKGTALSIFASTPDIPLSTKTPI